MKTKSVISIIAIASWFASIFGIQAADITKGSTNSITTDECLLLVANKQSSIWQEKKLKKGLTLKAIKEIYFIEDVYEDDSESCEFSDYVEEKEEKPVDYVIVSGSGPKAVGTTVFANSVGKDVAAIKGKKVVGEDKYVLKAVQTQPEAVSFIPANIVFSGENGTLAEGIEVIPFDIDGDGKVTEAERNAITSLEAFNNYINNKTKLLLVNHGEQ